MRVACIEIHLTCVDMRGHAIYMRRRRNPLHCKKDNICIVAAAAETEDDIAEEAAEAAWLAEEARQRYELVSTRLSGRVHSALAGSAVRRKSLSP